MLQSKALKGA